MSTPQLKLKPYVAGSGRIDVHETVTRLSLPSATQRFYSNAQLDDRTVQPDGALVHRPPLRLSLQARFSSESLLGTAGFGFWNLPALSPYNILPRAIWFFYASPPSRMDLALGVAGHGWKAATIDATRPQALAMAPLALPVMLLNRSQHLYRRIWPFVQRNLSIAEKLLPEDLLLDWHTYTIEWGVDEAQFSVDSQIVLRTRRPPRGPMCFVAWIDNRLAVVTPTGLIRFGLFDVIQPQWLEIENLLLAQ